MRRAVFKSVAQGFLLGALEARYSFGREEGGFEPENFRAREGFDGVRSCEGVLNRLNFVKKIWDCGVAKDEGEAVDSKSLVRRTASRTHSQAVGIECGGEAGVAGSESSMESGMSSRRPRRRAACARWTPRQSMLYPGARTPSSGQREIGDVMSGARREERRFGFTLRAAACGAFITKTGKFLQGHIWQYKGTKSIENLSGL
ncbi:hypothetical protein C8J57DRAFT_1560968 [Mycena rebaudengoi]|nr:hypothetical protein C8J57DRAFT_1560968 [Mycena rebaudengoi]